MVADRDISKTKLGNAVLWVLPIAFLFWLYTNGLKTWFAADDFAWLGLLRNVHNFRDLMSALFAPAAQGTIRPWSERGFFLLFEDLFGLDSLPFRICVFVTMAADLTVVAWITRRITGSPVAGTLAAILWSANTALVTVMAWSSAYNEALCPLFLLSGIALLIRYAESGHLAFWWGQLVVFILGFGALEVNVVYPALAAAYVLFGLPPEKTSPQKRRRVLVSLAPLFCISVAYFLVHRALAPLPKVGPYGVHMDGRMVQTLAVYWLWSLVPQTWRDLGHSAHSAWALVSIGTIALAVFLAFSLAKRRYFALFFVFWYFITLAPMIPLPDHRTDYYLTIPLIGLAMLGGWGLSQAWFSQTSGTPWLWRTAALIPFLAYLGCMLPVTRTASRWWLDRSQAVRGLVLGVRAAETTHPGKTIVLDGINSDLYDISVGQSAFAAAGLGEVYLTPNAIDTIHPANDFGKLSHVVMEPGVLRNALTHDQVVVYSEVGDHLRNITGVWEQSFLADTPKDQQPRRIEVGNPLMAYLLGPEWFPVESGFRWMPRRATVRLGGPKSTDARLLIEGYCPDQQLKAGMLHLSVSVDGIPLEKTQIGIPENNFRRLFYLPPSLVGRQAVEVAIAVDRAINDPGGRQLGLVFGTIAIQ